MMDRKQVRDVITANPGLAIYALEGPAQVGPVMLCIHSRISKTKAITHAKRFRAVRVQTFNEERPDLNGKTVNGDQRIITFDATPQP